MLLLSGMATGFNPLPLPKQGETQAADHCVSMLEVSIRSPYRSKGRRMELRFLIHLIKFQSAPLTEARGDMETISSP